MGRWVTTLLVFALLAACRRSEHALTMAVALLPSELAAYRAVLGDFERDTGLRVVVVPQQYPDIQRALAAEAFAGHGTLDLVELDVYALARSARHVSVLDPAELAPELDALAPHARRAGEIDGLRFLPHRISWQALVYNHAVLGKAPATWEELLAVARAHPKRIGLKGALYEGLTCDVLPFVWAAGGSGDRFDDPGTLAAFRFFAELAPYLAPQSETFKEATVAEAMARGELVLHVNWPFVMSLYASQGLAGTIRSAPLPQGPAGRATVLGGGYIAVPLSAPHRVAAVRLARYLISAPAQMRLRRQLGWFSARTDVAVDETSEDLGGFAAMRGEARPRPERPDYPRLSRAWQQAFRAVAFERSDPVSALQAAQRGLGRER
ncbi:MAG: extracellular solute-binding protein [Deltaproteobacteria bacterium]|nr:extracellular solute-binding protein [Deltaproteobacteria bacterium]